LLVDNQKHPWKYQKEVTFKAFKKFLKTQPLPEEQEKVYQKMSLANREGITTERLSSQTFEEAVKSWKIDRKNIRAESLDTILESFMNRDVIAI